MRRVFSPAQLEDEHTVVVAMDDSGPGGACHEYIVVKKTDWDEIPESRRNINGGEAFLRTRSLATIQFQKGALLEVGDLNGCFNEDLLVMVHDRLEAFASGPYPSRETSLSKTEIEKSLHWMRQRKIDRTRRGVQGKHEK